MKKKVETMEIRKVERLKNSYYGNPRYLIIVTLPEKNNDILIGNTASNAMIGYEIGYSSEGKTFKIEYHYTKRNNVVFDRIIK